ncbi:hypothetical protein PoB_001497400 [Plakobranchus ocellatus]|uniref:Uncharacterized protein n=1 Tax=Plakobranchus ocellatus TaxID=259542 RepID=A0AAV3YZK1_9GAST|nr:hypothetical protein PoB_001497400 [Plakobranchus ocellatus]
MRGFNTVTCKFLSNLSRSRKFGVTAVTHGRCKHHGINDPKFYRNSVLAVEDLVTQSQTYQVGQYLEVFLYAENGGRRPYRGIIQDCIDGEWEIRFMEMKGDAYVWPVKDDVSLVPGSDRSCHLQL